MTEKRCRVDDYLLAKAFRGLDDFYILIHPSNIYIHTHTDIQPKIDGIIPNQWKNINIKTNTKWKYLPFPNLVL